MRSALSLVLLAAAVAPGGAQELPFLKHSRVDPRQVMTAEACGECHISEYEVWESTPHAEGFKTLHRKKRAETIARKMGFRLIKRDSLCFSCHYTPTVQGDQIRVVSGVSCESCHGAGSEWIDVHSDYGSGAAFDTETAEHRRRRIERSREAGMRRPSDLYPVVANCFSCHTVPNEELVNVGGHTTGSAGFEFVEWAQGEIRHNFLANLRRGTFGDNAERPVERKRLMYVVGRALDLEYSLRGVAVATTDGVYAKAMIRRVRSALAELRAINGAAEIAAVGKMIAAARGARVVPRNRDELLAVAEEVGAATRRLLTERETLEIAALDAVMLGLPEEEPSVDTVVATTTGASNGSGAGGGVRGLRTAAGTGAAATTAAGSSAPSTAATGSGIVGEFKRRVRPATGHGTLGPAACGGCHGPQNEWWFADPHYRSADRFFDLDPQALRIARLYGISQTEMTRGRNVCMDCHGTIITGKESRDVLDGVSCESCHGAAADWLEPHKNEADGHLGRNRPGHLAALARGKLELRDQGVRAGTCAGCHYVTEPRLLSAGHPSGADFDYPAGIAEVRHWSFGLAPASELTTAFATVRADRGPVPDVPRVQLAAAGGAGGRSTTTSGSASRRATTSAPPLGDRRSGEVVALSPPLPRPAGPPGAATGGDTLALPPFPEIDESAPIEEVLLLLRERLRLLYRAVAGETTGGAS